MSTKKYREYYEKLAQVREELEKKHLREEMDKGRSFWSIKYKYKSKDILRKMIRERISRLEQPVVLDMGCGTGTDLACLAKCYQFRGIGGDLSFFRLKIASANPFLDDCKFLQLDVQKLPLRDCSVDMIICSEVIEHLPEVKSSLEEIQRILKKGGVVFITTPNRWNYFHALGQLIPRAWRKKLVRTISGEEIDADSSEYAPEEGMEEHIHLFTFLELKRTIKNLGFDVEELGGGMLQVPFPVIFDRCRFLQYFWQGFDRVISLFPLSKHLKATILLVGVKK